MLNFIRKKKIDSAREKSKRERVLLNYDSIKEVLLIFNLVNWTEVQKVAEALRNDGKTVTLWSARPKDKTQIQTANGVRVIDSSKEATWTQPLAKTVIDEFEKLNYDTLIDLTIESENVLEYLLAINTGKFCIGLRKNDSKEKVYDFTLLRKEEDDIFTTFEQMKYYLGKINC